MSPDLPAPAPADFEDELRPWERRLDLHETEAVYHAFCHFRDLPRAERAVNRAYTIHQDSCRKNEKAVLAQSQDSPELMDAFPYWKECKKRYRWEERIAVDIEHENREQRRKQIGAIEDTCTLTRRSRRPSRHLTNRCPKGPSLAAAFFLTHQSHRPRQALPSYGRFLT